MPEIKNLSLSVTFGPAERVTAKIQYDLQFSATEVLPNISFWEVAAVIGQHAQLDEWLPKAPYLRWIPPKHDKADALVKYGYQGTLVAGGESSIHRDWEVNIAGTWEQGRPGPGMERLRPLVYVTPLEVTTDLAVGDEVEVDLGG